MLISMRTRTSIGEVVASSDGLENKSKDLRPSRGSCRLFRISKRPKENDLPLGSHIIAGNSVEPLTQSRRFSVEPNSAFSSKHFG